jgi:hypothetical protein
MVGTPPDALASAGFAHPTSADPPCDPLNAASPGSYIGSRGPNRLDPLRVLGFQIPPRHFQVVVALKIEPELRTVAEVEAAPQRRVCRDAAPVVDDPAIRFGEIPIAFASALCDRPYAARNSSFSISPGVTGANSFFAIVVSAQL